MSGAEQKSNESEGDGDYQQWLGYSDVMECVPDSAEWKRWVQKQDNDTKQIERVHPLDGAFGSTMDVLSNVRVLSNMVIDYSKDRLDLLLEKIARYKPTLKAPFVVDMDQLDAVDESSDLAFLITELFQDYEDKGPARLHEPHKLAAKCYIRGYQMFARPIFHIFHSPKTPGLPIEAYKQICAHPAHNS